MPTWSEETQRSGLVPRTRTLTGVMGMNLSGAVQGDQGSMMTPARLRANEYIISLNIMLRELGRKHTGRECIL